MKYKRQARLLCLALDFSGGALRAWFPVGFLLGLGGGVGMTCSHEVAQESIEGAEDDAQDLFGFLFHDFYFYG